MTDPRIIKEPKVIDTITYRELRELSYMGATVLHEEAILSLCEKPESPSISGTPTRRMTREP